MKRCLAGFVVSMCFCMSCVAADGPGKVAGGPFLPLVASEAQNAVRALNSAGKNIDDLLILELNGQTYYVKDMALLEELVASGQDMCFTKGYGLDGTIDSLYRVLYESCTESRALLEGQALESGKTMFVAAVNKFDRISDSMRLSGNYKELLKQCLLNVQVLRDALSKTEMNTHAHIVGKNIDACIASVGISDTPVCKPDGSPIVANRNCLSGLSDLDTQYSGRRFVFQDSRFADGGASASDKVLVFNGKVLIACEGAKAKLIINPSFSGRQECQGGEYKQVPNVGSLPSGIYLAMPQEAESYTSESMLKQWGKYRVPLIASTATNDFGRSNFYLHGTSDETKMSSGGCISMGVNVDKLVESEWFKSADYIPVIVNIQNSVVTQKERQECSYGI